MKKQLRIYILYILLQMPFAVAQEGETALELTADSVEYDVKSEISTYAGNVLMRWGAIEVRGSLVEVLSRENSISRFYVREGPSSIRWQLDDGRTIRGHADTLRYDVSENTIRLKGNVRIKDDLREITGEDITYDLATQVLRANSGHGDRVRMKIQADPKSKRGVTRSPAVMPQKKRPASKGKLQGKPKSALYPRSNRSKKRKR